jgi:non-canonical (house-cleaning) NTP pyrophosphatase
VLVRPDGRLGFRRSIGLSSAWEVPVEVADAMYYRGRDMDQAFVDAGYTTDPRIGAGQGAVGLLSGGQLDRQRYTEQALLAAAIGAGLIPNATWKG